jgi:hypothetical protein
MLHVICWLRFLYPAIFADAGAAINKFFLAPKIPLILPNRTCKEKGMKRGDLSKKFFSKPKIFYTELGIIYLWLQINEVKNGNTSKRSWFKFVIEGVGCTGCFPVDKGFVDY